MDCSDHSSDDEHVDPEEKLNVKCLFCEFYSFSHDTIFGHINEKHGIDFINKCKTNNLDTFQFIKLVNYIRKNNDVNLFENILENKLFEFEEYLKPTLKDDHLLMFDYETEIEIEEPKTDILQVPESDIPKFYENASKHQLINDVINLKRIINDANITMDKMRKLLTIENVCNTNSVTTLNTKTDSEYIDSYSHYSIHHTMLADNVRNLAFQDAILENGSFFMDKIVLDIGCGTGILSLFAAKAGAKMVVAIDQSDIINNARNIIYDNGYEEKIHIVKGKLETIDFEKKNLPTKYDVIISEWMGYFLFFEGMLETVLYAKDNLLNYDGVLLPNRCKLFLSAFSDCKFYEQTIDFWKDVYGFNMCSMIDDIINESIVDSIDSTNICASTEKICDFNIATCASNFTESIHSTFELKFQNNSTIHGFVSWFDCYFESMSKLIILSTSPFSEPTHWKQTIFPLKEPILVKSGQVISGDITIERNPKNPRFLQVKIFLQKLNLKFIYNIC